LLPVELAIVLLELDWRRMPMLVLELPVELVIVLLELDWR